MSKGPTSLITPFLSVYRRYCGPSPAASTPVPIAVEVRGSRDPEGYARYSYVVEGDSKTLDEHIIKGVRQGT